MYFGNKNHPPVLHQIANPTHPVILCLELLLISHYLQDKV